MILFRPLFLAALMIAGPVAAAQANGTADMQACKAMAATLTPKQIEIAELTALRDEAAETVETTGEAWEDIEIHRRASAGHAAAADTAKTAYDEAKKRLARDELALQASVRQYNDDVAAFNSRCTKN